MKTFLALITTVTTLLTNVYASGPLTSLATTNSDQSATYFQSNTGKTLMVSVSEDDSIETMLAKLDFAFQKSIIAISCPSINKRLSFLREGDVLSTSINNANVSMSDNFLATLGFSDVTAFRYYVQNTVRPIVLKY